MKITTNVASGSITTTTFQTETAFWGTPIFIEAKEVGESIEFLYRQISNRVTLQYPSPPPEERVFKIVYSCKKGKWHKSEPVYGKIIPAQEEYYEFD